MSQGSPNQWSPEVPSHPDTLSISITPSPVPVNRVSLLIRPFPTCPIPICLSVGPSLCCPTLNSVKTKKATSNLGSRRCPSVVTKVWSLSWGMSHIQRQKWVSVDTPAGFVLVLRGWCHLPDFLFIIVYYLYALVYTWEHLNKETDIMLSSWVQMRCDGNVAVCVSSTTRSSFGVKTPSAD